MKYILLLVLGSMNLFATELPDFPKGPDARLTPGELCTTPSRRRYPENIAYCDRMVERETKEQIFSNYRRLGFALAESRENYKIDHYIPLCMGGSNSIKNLWPQHETIFHITDEIEGLGCSKLSLGLIKQKDVIALIRKVKADNSQAKKVMDYLYSL